MKSYRSTKQDHADVSMKCTLGLCYDSEDDDNVSSILGATPLEEYMEHDHHQNLVKYDLFETEPADLVLGVFIESLPKKYKNSAVKVTLKNLTLNMYEGQITALGTQWGQEIYDNVATMWSTSPFIRNCQNLQQRH